MKQDQMNVLFEEIERFAASVATRLLALEGQTAEKKATKPKARKATVPDATTREESRGQ